MKAQIINNMFLIQGLFYIIEQEESFEFYSSNYQLVLTKNYLITNGACYALLSSGPVFTEGVVLFLEESHKDLIADIDGAPDIYLTSFNFETLKKFINYEKQEEFSRSYRQSIQ